MAEDRNHLIAHYHCMREEMVAVLDGLGDDLMTDRSLDGWSVKDHLAHLAFWDDLRAGEVVRVSAGYDSVWRMSGEQEAALNAIGHAARRELRLDQVRWEFATSRQRLLQALASATERGLEASLYGEASLRSTHEAQHTVWIARWRREKGL